MENRTWDPKGFYKDGFVKEYSHWILEVSFRQHTLGCFIIFAKRDIEKISELRDDELLELKKVMLGVELVIKKLFSPDRFNYLQMGNALHRLHFHGIPRYKKPQEFDGKIWNDRTYGHPPIWKKTEVEKKLIIKLRKMILSELT